MLESLRNLPAFLDGVAAMGGMVASDLAGLRHGISGDDLDEWDPDYIRRALPIMGPLLRNYFRGDVRGLENIPADGPACWSAIIRAD
jgi:hypothetical protein